MQSKRLHLQILVLVLDLGFPNNTILRTEVYQMTRPKIKGPNPFQDVPCTSCGEPSYATLNKQPYCKVHFLIESRRWHQVAKTGLLP